VQFKDTLTLTTSDGHRMGSVVVTKKPEHLVSVTIEGLPPGARVRTVLNGQAGAEETPGRSMLENRVRVDTSASAFVRVEAYTAEGRPLVYSNPIYFRTDDDGTISASKRAICR
jgi:hypothetical protein